MGEHHEGVAHFTGTGNPPVKPPESTEEDEKD